MREVVGRYQEQVTGSGHLLLDIVGTPGTVSADPDRIEQVLTNLLDNALKYSPDVAELHVRIQTKARGLLLEVQDHGIGLPREAAERMSGGGFRHLIVLGRGGQVEGVLSIRDLMRALLHEANVAP